jgi:NAD(P)-dependent dehydrogenase (short-subunit alcohol dehydrogenase family)
MRVKDKIIIVIGAGQQPGESIGIGRATALLLAREGSQVIAGDVEIESATETCELDPYRRCVPQYVDVTKENTIADMVETCLNRYGRIDGLFYNVGTAQGGNDLLHTNQDGFQSVLQTNLIGLALAFKHVLPVMINQGSGSIVANSSIAAVSDFPNLAYKASKAGMIAVVEQIARENARFGIRANCVLPGYIDTPMSVDLRAKIKNQSRDQIVRRLGTMVPLKGGMGNAWQVAHAVLYLISDDAAFVTGVNLPVDGGSTLHS